MQLSSSFGLHRFVPATAPVRVGVWNWLRRRGWNLAPLPTEAIPVSNLETDGLPLETNRLQV